ERAMTNFPVVQKVAVFSHTGNGNLGDDATLAVVLQNVRLRCPGAEISAFTLDPADTAERHQVRAFPIVRSRRGASRSSGQPAGAGPVARPGLADRLKGWFKKVPALGTLARAAWRAAAAVPAAVAELRFLVRSGRRLKGIDLFIVAGGGQLGDYFGGAWG